MHSSSRRASEIASNAICLARDCLSAGGLSENSCRYGSAARAVSPGRSRPGVAPIFLHLASSGPGSRPRGYMRPSGAMRLAMPTRPAPANPTLRTAAFPPANAGGTTTGWFRASPFFRASPGLPPEAQQSGALPGRRGRAGRFGMPGVHKEKEHETSRGEGSAGAFSHLGPDVCLKRPDCSGGSVAVARPGDG